MGAVPLVRVIQVSRVGFPHANVKSAAFARI